MTFLIAPDSFKGTLTAQGFCEIAKETIERILPGSRIICLPCADGGEGTVDALQSSLQGTVRTVDAHGPCQKKVFASYLLAGDGKTAVIEMCATAGFSQKDEGTGPCDTTTLGVGEMIKDACEAGAKEVVVSLGGSCTNDGGCGAAYACGTRFYDKNGNTFIPTGRTLSKIARIDNSGLEAAFQDVRFTVMCDVDNPATGEYGCARIFAPQKGASEEDVLLLEDGMKNLCQRLKNDIGRDVETLPGSGAAGGMGAGMIAMFGAKMKSGIETVLELTHFDEKAKDADYVLTGEGCFDGQSLKGKTVYGVLRHSAGAGKKVIVLAGTVKDEEIGKVVDDFKGVSVFSIARKPEPLAEAFKKTKENLRYTLENVLRLLPSC